MYFHEFALKNEREHAELADKFSSRFDGLSARMDSMSARIDHLEARVDRNATYIRNWLVLTVLAATGGITGLNQLVF